MMNRLKILLAACAIASCSACQSAGTPEASVNNYLKSLSREDSRTSQGYVCWQGEDAKKLRIELPTGIKKWEVTGEQEKTSEKDPDSRFSLVSARIESASVGGFPVTKTWTFEVWKSDEFYESSKRTIDRVNQTLASSDKVLANGRKLLGQPDPPPSETMLVSPPERKQVSSNPYCVLAVKPIQ